MKNYSSKSGDNSNLEDKLNFENTYINDLLCKLIDNSKDGVVIYNNNFVVIHQNKSHIDIFGKWLHYNQNVFDLEQNENLKQTITYKVETTGRYYDKVIIDTKYGTSIFDLFIYPILNQNQELIGYISYFKSSIEDEQINIEYKNKYELFTENITDVLWVYNITHKTFSFISKSVEKLRGFNYKDAMLETIEESIAPQHRDYFLNRMISALNDFRKGTKTEYIMTIQQICSDGSYVWVEISEKINLAQDGSIELIGVTRNINDRIKTEILLRENEEKYKSIADNSTDLIFIINILGEILFINKSVNKYGYTETEIIGNTISNYFPSKYKANLIKSLQYVYDKKIVQNINTQLINKKGDFIDVEINASLIRFNNQIVIQGSIRDITLRNQNELLIKKLITAIEQSPTSIVITDIDGKIEYVNKKFTEITGYNKNEVMGQNPSLLRTNKTPVYRYKDLWNTIKKGKEWRGRFVNQKKNGQIYYESAVIAPVFDSHRNIKNFVAVKQDITNQRKIYYALKKSENKLKAIFDNANISIVIANQEGKFILANQNWCDLIGYNSCEILKLSYFDITYPDDIQLSTDFLDRLKNDELNKYIIEKRFVSKKGSIIWVSMAVSMVKDEKDNIQMFICVMKDITNEKLSLIELTETKKQLEITNSTKDKFFSIIAHDLKNPIGNYYQLTSLVHDTFNSFSKEELMEILSILKDSSSKIYSLLDNLLVWARTQRGTIPFQAVAINFVAIINDVFQLLSLNADQKQIKLVNLTKENMIIVADLNCIRTIMRNLLSNAIKFSKKGGAIHVNCISDENNYIVSVRDTGVGMSQETINKLFKIDVNLTTIGTAEEKGSGLGLILIKEFVDMHNGTIWVDSKIGVGSTFYFTIPKKLK